MSESQESAANDGPAGLVVGVPKETAEGETRVAMVPRAIGKLLRRNIRMVVESGAGEGAALTDEQYTEAGAEIGDPWSADIVVKVTPPTEEEVGKLAKGTVLIGFLAPLTNTDGVAALESAGLKAFAMESIPRISRAQGMDALSSQANVAGYRTVLIAAQHLPRFVPMLTTAAGTVPPATTLVLGVGVAGLQALATARRLGSRTTGYDVRPEVADQVRSVGAKWLELDIDATGEGGYARELSDEEKSEQQRQLTEAIKDFDMVITTALVPGKEAPKLVTEDAVQGMKHGSVIVDMAGETGGNCELTEPGETVTKHGVTIVSPLNLPAGMPEHSSELYARNISQLLELMVSTEGELNLDFSDEVIAKSCVAGAEKPPEQPDDSEESEQSTSEQSTSDSADSDASDSAESDTSESESAESESGETEKEQG